MDRKFIVLLGAGLLGVWACGSASEDLQADVQEAMVGLDCPPLSGIDSWPDLAVLPDDPNPADHRPVLLYVDAGTWGSGMVAIARFLDFAGFQWLAVEASDIVAGDVLDDASAIWMPGGWAPSYIDSLGSVGLEHIRAFVDHGGGYVGTCAGAYLAAERVVWDNVAYEYPLGLWSGTANGPQGFAWPAYGLVEVAAAQGHPLVPVPATMQVLMYGGSRFDGALDGDVLARFTLDESAAAVAADYGEGRVLLMGFHGEIEEGEAQDGVAFGDALADPDSEWPMLAHWIAWAVGGQER